MASSSSFSGVVGAVTGQTRYIEIPQNKIYNIIGPGQKTRRYIENKTKIWILFCGDEEGFVPDLNDTTKTRTIGLYGDTEQINEAYKLIQEAIGEKFPNVSYANHHYDAPRRINIEIGAISMEVTNEKASRITDNKVHFQNRTAARIEVREENQCTSKVCVFGTPSQIALAKKLIEDV